MGLSFLNCRMGIIMVCRVVVKADLICVKLNAKHLVRAMEMSTITFHLSSLHSPTAPGT